MLTRANFRGQFTTKNEQKHLIIYSPSFQTYMIWSFTVSVPHSLTLCGKEPLGHSAWYH